MSEIRKYVDQWLRDAHAMEKQAESILHGQIKRIENYPELAGRMQAHLDETTSQRERLETCLERRGTSASGFKDFSAQFTAMMQNLGGVFAGDEVVKGVLASYAFEAMEIASYRILAAAAEAEGKPYWDLGGKAHRFGYGLWIVAKAVFEISLHRQGGCPHNHLGMGQRIIAADCTHIAAALHKSQRGR